jgi:hypothetical protein
LSEKSPIEFSFKKIRAIFPFKGFNSSTMPSSSQEFAMAVPILDEGMV